MKQIIIIEDDENIRELIAYALESSGFKVIQYSDGSQLFSTNVLAKTDLIVLDIMLPIEDGLSILRRLKLIEEYKNIPVVMLTAKSQELDKVKALDNGADDYITKPFSVLEVISRIKAVLRRVSPREKEDTIVKFGEIIMDINKRAVLVKDKEVALTYKEFELLHYFILNKGVVLNRNQILNAIWNYDFEGESRTVDVHINTLRQKLKECGSYIKTIRNVGYIIQEN